MGTHNCLWHWYSALHPFLPLALPNLSKRLWKSRVQNALNLLLLYPGGYFTNAKDFVATKRQHIISRIVAHPSMCREKTRLTRWIWVEHNTVRDGDVFICQGGAVDMENLIFGEVNDDICTGQAICDCNRSEPCMCGDPSAEDQGCCNCGCAQSCYDLCANIVGNKKHTFESFRRSSFLISFKLFLELQGTLRSRKKWKDLFFLDIFITDFLQSYARNLFFRAFFKVFLIFLA